MKRWAIHACALSVVVGVLSGCAVEEEGPIEQNAQPLGAELEVEGPERELEGESSEPPPVVAEWLLSSKLETRGAQEGVALRVTNHTQMAVSIEVAVESLGLRRLRAIPMGSQRMLEPGESLEQRWLPADAPLQSVGSSLETTVRVAWSAQMPVDEKRYEPVSGVSSSEHMYVSYSQDYRRVFLSREDDLSVRLESARTTELSEQAAPSRPKSSQLAAVLSLSESPRGKIDGRAVSTQEILSVTGTEEAHSDTLSLDPEWERAAISDPDKLSESTAQRGITDGSVDAAAACLNAGRMVVYKNVCVMMRGAGMYNDSNVSASGIPVEDRLRTDTRAAYIKASIA